MKMTILTVVLGAAVSTAAWAGGATSSAATPDSFQVAQSDFGVHVGPDRDHGRDYRSRHDRDFSVGIGPGGVQVGPRDHCRTVTTTVERGGRSVTRRERRCD